jgi:hypothetical protein
VKFRVLSPALEEVSQAALWFDTQRAGLGVTFWQAVDEVLVRIEGNPHQFAKSEFATDEFEFRYALVRPFNYVVHYLVTMDEVQVVCIPDRFAPIRRYTSRPVSCLNSGSWRSGWKSGSSITTSRKFESISRAWAR